MGPAVRQLSIQAVAAVVWATVPPPDRPPGFCLSSNDAHRLVCIGPLNSVYRKQRHQACLSVCCPSSLEEKHSEAGPSRVLRAERPAANTGPGSSCACKRGPSEWMNDAQHALLRERKTGPEENIRNLATNVNCNCKNWFRSYTRNKKCGK